jgi:FMN phosphatase YigB (HAD superfamily)
MPPRPLRALLFDAGYTLLEMDYGALTAQLRARGHPRDEAAVIDAERRARMRLEVERAAQAAAGRTGEGRYLRYVLEQLAITDESERGAIAEWRRGFNPPVGLCHRADGEAAKALQRARAAGCVVGVISNSNGSVRRALEEA